MFLGRSSYWSWMLSNIYKHIYVILGMFRIYWIALLCVSLIIYQIITDTYYILTKYIPNNFAVTYEIYFIKTVYFRFYLVMYV